jgi:hypothetical protein
MSKKRNLKANSRMRVGSMGFKSVGNSNQQGKEENSFGSCFDIYKL